MSDQFDTQFLDVPGGRIAYDDRGDQSAPLVVLLAGMGEVRQSFRFLVPLLIDAGYRVVTTDARGHGESSADWSTYGARHTGDDVLALIRHLGVPTVLLGHSAGAASVIWAAAREKELVTAIVLDGPFLDQKPVPLWLRIAFGAVGRSTTLWGPYYTSLYPGAKPADFAEYRRMLTRSLKGRMRAVREYPATAAECIALAGTVTVPVLVVMGDRDPDFRDPAAAANLAHPLFSQTTTTVELIEGSGHYPHADAPEPTAKAIVRFLSTVASRG